MNENVKLIIGRNENENDRLSELSKDEIVLQAKDFPGPLGIIQSKEKLTIVEIKHAGSILLRYNSKVEKSAIVQYGKNYKLNEEIEVEKMANEKIEQYLL